MAGPPTILIIDDDPDFVRATRKVLESVPYRVLAADNGDDGIKMARAEKPDLILLDIIMPLRDGFSTCEAIKSDPSLEEVPVVMLTSFAQKVAETSLSVSQGMALEADDYIDKPVAPAELLKRVARLLSRR
jgi:two-component system alkaline phosphatase synthesis response regulator PhoP